MSTDQYVLWFIGMVVATLVILVVGTLGMAGLLRRAGKTLEPSTTVRRSHLYVAPEHRRADQLDDAA